MCAFRNALDAEQTLYHTGLNPFTLLLHELGNSQFVCQCVCQQAKDVLTVWLQVHAYTACPNDETAYLAELKSGKEVLVVNAQGQQKTALVGRVKIETRPLVSTVKTVDTVYNSSPLRLLCT